MLRLFLSGLTMPEIIDAYCTPGTERETRLAPDELLRQMDEAGIRRAVVAPEDREIAVENRAGNDRVLVICERSAGRFLPAATVNPWFGAAGCRELKRAVDRGAKLLVLAPALQGFCPIDEVADPLVETAGRLGVAVYLHTGPHSYGAPSQVILLALRHPEVRFIVGHCGSTDYAHDMPAVVRNAPENVWFELGLARPWAAAEYVKQGNRRKFLFGSSAPRKHPAMELRHLAHDLPIEDYADVYGGNAAELLGL